jgi:diguanylate cyclase (GGDEF)-like protein/PAS domain S-box-containing protein
MNLLTVGQCNTRKLFCRESNDMSSSNLRVNGLLSVVIFVVATIWLWNDYQNTLKLSAIQQANVAQLLETHTSHVISNADAVLDRVGDEIQDHAIMGEGADRRWQVLGEIAKKLPVSGRLWLYRPDGSAVMASHLRHSSNNANDREYFNAQKAPGAGLFIGETVVGKTTGKKVFNLSRRINAPDGSFGGVIMAAIDIDVFIQVVSELNLGQSAAYALVRNDGAVIMRYPDAGATGRRYNLRTQTEVAKAPVGFISTVSSIDGVERLLAYRKHPTLPLTVVVSLSRDEVLAPWRQRALMMGGGLGVLLLAAGYLAWVAHQATRRELRAVMRMQKVLNTVGDGICGLDAQGSIAFINPAGARLLGAHPDALTGKNFHDTAHRIAPSDASSDAPQCPIRNLIERGGETQGTESFYTQSGKQFVADYTATCVDDLDGQPGVVLAFRDVSAMVAAQNSLQRQKEFVITILDSLSEHIAVIDSRGIITAVNSAWRNFAAANGAAGAPEVAVGANYLDTCAKAAELFQSEDAAKALAGIKAVLARERPEFSQEYPCHAPDQQRWFLQQALPLGGEQPGAVIIHQDVTTRKVEESAQLLAQQQLEIRLNQAAERQLRLQDQANRDQLTGINNRRYFDEVMPRELSVAQRDGYPLVVIMLDLDHFKRVNDTHGHAAGDEVLKALAGLLKSRARENDIICRYGGEEFVVTMTRMSAERAWQRIESWRNALADLPVVYGDLVIQVTFSAGMTEFPEDGAELATLLKHADEALYRAKANGRNRVCVFTRQPPAASTA